MWCQCGTTFSFAFVSDTFCNLPCRGNSAEICGGGTTGGPIYSSVYSTCKIFVKVKSEVFLN